MVHQSYECSSLSFHCRNDSVDAATAADLENAREQLNESAMVLAEKEIDFARRQQVNKEENGKCIQRLNSRM